MAWTVWLGLLACDREGSSGTLDAGDVCDRATEVVELCFGSSASATGDCEESLNTCTEADLEAFMAVYDCIAESCDILECTEAMDEVSGVCLGATSTPTSTSPPSSSRSRPR